MSGIYGNEPRYSVHYERGKMILYKGFHGDRAFSDASDFYDELKRDLDVNSLWMTRLAGGEWIWVEKPMKRNADNVWEPD